MPVPFKIKITNEILEKSKYCSSYGHELQVVGENCAIAHALKDLFPRVHVSGLYIYPFGFNDSAACSELKIELPQIAKDFIRVFDALCNMPAVRLRLPELEFEITIPDAVISLVDINEVEKIIAQQSPQLV